MHLFLFPVENFNLAWMPFLDQLVVENLRKLTLFQTYIVLYICIYFATLKIDWIVLPMVLVIKLLLILTPTVHNFRLVQCTQSQNLFSFRHVYKYTCRFADFFHTSNYSSPATCHSSDYTYQRIVIKSIISLTILKKNL